MHKGRDYPQILNRWILPDYIQPHGSMRQILFQSRYFYQGEIYIGLSGYSEIAVELPDQLQVVYDFPLLTSIGGYGRPKIVFDGSNDPDTRGVYLSIVGGTNPDLLYHLPWGVEQYDMAAFPSGDPWVILEGADNPRSLIDILIQGVDWHTYPAQPGDIPFP